MAKKKSNTPVPAVYSRFLPVGRTKKKPTDSRGGVKLSRLLLEFKEKLDKHRRPHQQIQVQHNHVYNEGQAIIGAQF